MSNTSRNNSSTSLMGFSVHQPSIGSPLQFFPAMGSKQLDEMIDAYVPGNAPIADKRATVSMEFFEHSMATGELFKFFMVYPSLGSATESPSGSMLDSGYGSSFTSPVMSESQWAQAGGPSLQTREAAAEKPSAKRATLSNDFSHLPGMKIITKDGKDVTNMTSRGCKTKEQRDHAHLMRIIKACDSCRRKKVRCDPSHKRPAGSSTARISKKTKKIAASTIPSSAPPPPPPQQTSEPLKNFVHTPASNISNDAPSLSFESAMSEPLVDLTMDWNQFIQFDEEPTEPIPFDYDFFHDPQGLLSPTSYNSFSPSLPITPAQTLGVESTETGATEDEVPVPLPPYLNPGGETGSDYADFDLYSPGSSTSLEDDPSLSKEVAAMPLSGYVEYFDRQRPINSHDRDNSSGDGYNFSTNVQHHASNSSPEQGLSSASLDIPLFNENVSLTTHNKCGRAGQDPEWCIPPVSPSGLSTVSPASSNEPWSRPQPRPQPHGITLPVDADEEWSGTNSSPLRLNATSSDAHKFRLRSSSLSGALRINQPAMTDQHQQNSVAVLTSGAGTWTALHGVSVVTVPETTELFKSLQEHDKQAHSRKTGYIDTPKLLIYTHANHVTNGLSPSPASLPSPQENVSQERNSTSLSPVSSSQLAHFSRNAVEKTRSSYAIKPSIEDAHESSSSANANADADSLAAQDVAIAGTSRQSRLGKHVPSISPLRASNGVFYSGVLFSALAMTTLYVLPFLLAMGALFRSRIFSNSAKKCETTPRSAVSLPIASTSIKLRQRATEHADTLDLSANLLSLSGQLLFAVSDSIQSKYSQFPDCLSKIRRSYHRMSTLQEPGRVRRLQRSTTIVW
ncbi:hypothetical protein F5B19DRAFT_186680 [Rostrohypoxylon terebratum]|nr:hypothetical protein F5B19DRAFT_186680 [Rostrohypoxylon terebratum]